MEGALESFQNRSLRVDTENPPMSVWIKVRANLIMSEWQSAQNGWQRSKVITRTCMSASGPFLVFLTPLQLIEKPTWVKPTVFPQYLNIKTFL